MRIKTWLVALVGASFYKMLVCNVTGKKSAESLKRGE